MLEFKDHTNRDNIIQMQGIGQSYDGGQNWIIKDMDFLIENKPDLKQTELSFQMRSKFQESEASLQHRRISPQAEIHQRNSRCLFALHRLI